ncbi:serine hydrolase [Streptomyces sp. O3]
MRRRHRHVPAAAALLLGWGLVSCAPDPASAAYDGAPPTDAVAAEPSAYAVVGEARVDPDERLAEALAPVVPEDGPTRVSVAVMDLGDGALAVYGDDETFDTASIVKVDVLAALLLRAQDEGRRLTPREREYAADMIVNSGNESTTELWATIGHAEGLDAANQRLGLTGTRAGERGAWGLTQTTAADQVALLRAVFGGDESELSEASRAYIQGLMGRIADGQGWGVSAAGSDGALKNGWLPRSTTGLWDVNSIGRVTADGHDCLIAVLSDGHATKEAGVALTEEVSKAAAASLTS